MSRILPGHEKLRGSRHRSRQFGDGLAGTCLLPGEASRLGADGGGDVR
jgi:hypothetical protein